jgi:hypothetical protein
MFQRIGGIAIVALAGAGLFDGGWARGWMWAGGAYAIVAGLTVVVGTVAELLLRPQERLIRW